VRRRAFNFGVAAARELFGGVTTRHYAPATYTGERQSQAMLFWSGRF